MTPSFISLYKHVMHEVKHCLYNSIQLLEAQNPDKLYCNLDAMLNFEGNVKQ